MFGDYDVQSDSDQDDKKKRKNRKKKYELKNEKLKHKMDLKINNLANKQISIFNPFNYVY